MYIYICINVYRFIYIYIYIYHPGEMRGETAPYNLVSRRENSLLAECEELASEEDIQVWEGDRHRLD